MASVMMKSPNDFGIKLVGLKALPNRASQTKGWNSAMKTEAGVLNHFLSSLTVSAIVSSHIFYVLRLSRSVLRVAA